nr:glycosyltransferase family A protein [uncultured Albidiferax sp.]
MKITVAIPTIEGRSTYLEACLRTCISQDEDFEILISDNPGGTARDVVESFNDSRIRYVTPPRYLAMSAHWDFVLSEVNGDFLTFIGDDDGLMPECIKRVKNIISQVGDIPIHHALANYCWPDFSNEKKRNTVAFIHATGWGGEMVQSGTFLEKIAKGRARYVDGPMVYHNFIPTTLLRRLVADGVFFRRSSPDLYSSIAIAANTPHFFSTKELLTLSGQGAKANGAAVQLGKGSGFLAEAKAFYAPRYEGVSIQMALLDALVEVAEYFKQPDLLFKIDYAAHFSGVIREARLIAPGLRAQEIKFALKAARRHGVLLSTGADLVGSIAHKVFHPSAAISTKVAYQSNKILQMPYGTKDIYDATQDVFKILKNFKKD